MVPLSCFLLLLTLIVEAWLPMIPCPSGNTEFKRMMGKFQGSSQVAQCALPQSFYPGPSPLSTFSLLSPLVLLSVSGPLLTHQALASYFLAPSRGKS